MVEYSIMKKGKLFIKKAFYTSIIAFLLASCASTQSGDSNKTSKKTDQTQEISEPEPSPAEIFIQTINTFSLKFTKSPDKTKKGKEFNSAFEVTVYNKDQQPVSGFDVCFLYPTGKNGFKLEYDTVIVTTNENGIASFNPGVINFAAKDQVIAYPDIPGFLNFDGDYKTIPLPYAEADFLVESDVAEKGAIMFVFEFTEGGKPSKNSYEILSALRKKGGSMISNGPISDDTSYITASKQKIYKDNYEYVEDQFGYLIGGTVKFANPVEANEDGTYTAHLIAEIYGIDMKTGEVIYEETNEYTSTGTNWSKAVESCKEKLTAIVVDSIMYGL